MISSPVPVVIPNLQCIWLLTLFALCFLFGLHLEYSVFHDSNERLVPHVHVSICVLLSILGVCVFVFLSAYVSQPLFQAHLNQQGCIHISRAPLNISQRVGWGALPSAWTMDRLAWHGTGNEYRRQPCITATAELQLVQRLSSLPSGECFIVLYLTNAGKAFAFPYQAVRILFDEMRRYRVTNLPRGCCWGASKVLSLRVAQVSKNKRPPMSQLNPRLPSKAAQAGSPAAPGWRGVTTASHLKSNQLQTPKGRGIAELFPQSPKKQMSQNTNTEPHPEKEKNWSMPFQ